jgi:hypothetical protein
MKNVAKIIKARGGLRALAGFPAGTGKAIRVEAEGFMDLHIECIGESPHGEGMVLVSVAHYGEQNGDLMRDPDVVFDVNTSDDPLIGWEFGNWRPVSFRNDYAGLFQEALFVEDGRVMVRPGLVKELRAFARTWDRNIKAQGFVEAAGFAESHA